jgi:hypothetical protein
MSASAVRLDTTFTAPSTNEERILAKHWCSLKHFSEEDLRWIIDQLTNSFMLNTYKSKLKHIVNLDVGRFLEMAGSEFGPSHAAILSLACPDHSNVFSTIASWSLQNNQTIQSI